jgi:hypothetical protein
LKAGRKEGRKGCEGWEVGREKKKGGGGRTRCVGKVRTDVHASIALRVFITDEYDGWIRF